MCFLTMAQVTEEDLKDGFRAGGNGVMLRESHAQWPMRLIFCPDALPEPVVLNNFCNIKYLCF